MKDKLTLLAEIDAFFTLIPTEELYVGNSVLDSSISGWVDMVTLEGYEVVFKQLSDMGLHTYIIGKTPTDFPKTIFFRQTPTSLAGTHIYYEPYSYPNNPIYINF